MAFVGRERELAQLAEAVRAAAEGRSGHVVLTGPAGIGCTRLLDELCRRMANVARVVTCRGRSLEPALGQPFQAVGDALAGALTCLPDDSLAAVVGSAGHDLAVLIPPLAKRLDALGIDRVAPRLVAPDQQGRRVVESILGSLERFAAQGVVLFILEDIHLADPATRGLIGDLWSVGRSLPVCVVVSFQPDVLHRRHPVREMAERLAADPEALHIALGALSPAQVERVVLDDAPDSPRGSLRPAVVEGAHGNPLMALWLARSAETLEGVRLSDPFEEIVGARLEEMPREVARVVRVLATARMPLPRHMLLRVEPPEGRLTIQALEAAIMSGYVIASGDVVEIAHELIGEAVEALELTPERQELNAALAQQLGATPALAAWHWSRAARPLEAHDAHIRAATSALRLDPGETVLAHYEEALEMPRSVQVTAEERAALLAGAAASCASAGQYRRAVALQRRAIESRAVREGSAAPGGRDAATRLALGEMYAELGRYQWAGGETDGAVDSMERALGIMPDRPSRIRARAQASLAQHLMIAGRFEESAAIARAALATATAAAALDEETLAERGHASCTLGMDVAYLGDLEGGLALLEEAAAIARQAGRLDDLMRIAANRTTLLDLDSRREEALAVVQSSLLDAAAGGLAASYGAFLRGNSADILYHLGRWQEAEVECRQALDWHMTTMESDWLPPLVLGLLLTESRADAEAERLVGKTMLQLETVPPGQWTGHVLRAVVSQALWSGEPEAALSVAEREWPRALESGELAVVGWAASTCLEAAAEAADHGRETSDTGLILRARSLAKRVLPEATATVASSPIAPELGARREAELWLEVARTNATRVAGGGDPDAWDRLAGEWAARSMRYVAAKCRWWQGLALLATADEGDRESARLAARRPLGEAYRIARELPALPLLRAVVDLASRARVPLPVMDEVLPGGRTVTEQPVATGSGRPRRRAAVPVGPGWPTGTSASGAADQADVAAVGRDIARQIDEQVIAALRRAPVDAYGLSPREHEVLVILAEGRTDRDIAARLFISERTVHVHVRRILAKLGVSSRTEAAGVAIRQGLVPAVVPHATGGAGSRPRAEG